MSRDIMEETTYCSIWILCYLFIALLPESPSICLHYFVVATQPYSQPGIYFKAKEHSKKLISADNSGVLPPCSLTQKQLARQDGGGTAEFLDSG